MAVYKEIVTKAIIGKGKKDYHDTYDMTLDVKPNTVLSYILTSFIGNAFVQELF